MWRNYHVYYHVYFSIIILGGCVDIFHSYDSNVSWYENEISLSISLFINSLNFNLTIYYWCTIVQAIYFNSWTVYRCWVSSNVAMGPRKTQELSKRVQRLSKISKVHDSIIAVGLEFSRLCDRRETWTIFYTKTSLPCNFTLYLSINAV